MTNNPTTNMSMTELIKYVLSTNKLPISADQIVNKCVAMRPDLYSNPRRTQLTRALISSLYKRNQIIRTELKQSIQAPGQPIKFVYSAKRRD